MLGRNALRRAGEYHKATNDACGHRRKACNQAGPAKPRETDRRDGIIAVLVLGCHEG
jgi:hypothetical protein